MSSEAKVFASLVVFVGVLVLAAVAYDIYLHPPDPQPVGTARIEVSRKPDEAEGVSFRGTLGTVGDEHVIEGRTPLTFTIPYRRADYVTASLERRGGQSTQGTLEVAIKQVIPRAKDKTVDRGLSREAGGRVFLVWKPSVRSSDE